MPRPAKICAAMRVYVAIALALVAVAGTTTRAASPVQIGNVAVVDGRVTITGSSFGSTPSVTVGGTPLGIVSSSDTEIVAQLGALAPGTYELTVARGGAAPGDSATTTVIIQ